MLFIWGCDQGRDIEKSDIKIARFEQDLFSISVYDLEDSIPWLQARYPDFFPLFTYKVIEIGGPGEQGFEEKLIAFTTDFTIYKVSRHIHTLYSDLSVYEEDLGNAFGRYLADFPGRAVPRIISCISGFNQSIITTDSLLAISLDKYLGEEDEFYKLLYPPVPEYMRRVMRPEKIVPDALQAWLITEFPYSSEKDNLLSQMIYHGRTVYCTQHLIPDIPDTLLWGYTRGQMDFCRQNERNMWEYLVENKKLFNTDRFTVSQFINEAPFTKEYSQESPGKAAVWQGYKIVKSYVKHNPDVSMYELMTENNYQKILNLSKYNP
jgi:hypothetical protein